MYLSATRLACSRMIWTDVIEAAQDKSGTGGRLGRHGSGDAMDGMCLVSGGGGSEILAD
jgi:hypothetical protein